MSSVSESVLCLCGAGCAGECDLVHNGTAASLDVQLQAAAPLWAQQDDETALEQLANMLVCSFSTCAYS